MKAPPFIIVMLAGAAALTGFGAMQDAGSGESTRAPEGNRRGRGGVEFTESEIRRILTLSPMPDVPDDPTSRVSDSDEAAQLGQYLFFDTGLSGDGTMSCAICHVPERAFTDGRRLAERALDPDLRGLRSGMEGMDPDLRGLRSGVKGSGIRSGVGQGVRNTVSLLNAAHQRWYFWDGRADSLWSQALSPLESPSEMAGSRLHVTLHIRRHAELLAAYERVFGAFPDLPRDDDLPTHARPMPDEPDHIHHRAWLALTDGQRAAVNEVFVNVGKAIASYERRLVTSDAPFDRFVEALRTGHAGGRESISPAAQRGLKLFIGKANCRLCHSGPLLTDFEFHDVGVPPREGLPPDAGRFAGIESLQSSPFRAAGRFSDDPDGPAALRTQSLIRSPETWGQFRTPSLRNVALTAPYMHQGQYADLREVLHHYSTLEDAVRVGHHQEQVLTPLNLTDEEIDDLIAFLQSLTGDPVPDALLKAPASPMR